MPTIRQARVGEMIKRDLAEIMQRDMRDPRLALVSITGVDVARDFTIAKVFVSVIGTPEEKAAAVKALNGASGFLRGQLGHRLEMRTVPTLTFRYDTGIERGVRMFDLLREEEKLIGESSEPGIEKPEPEMTEADFARDEDDDSEAYK